MQKVFASVLLKQILQTTSLIFKLPDSRNFFHTNKPTQTPIGLVKTVTCT